MAMPNRTMSRVVNLTIGKTRAPATAALPSSAGDSLNNPRAAAFAFGVRIFADGSMPVPWQSGQVNLTPPAGIVVKRQRSPVPLQFEHDVCAQR